MRIEFFAAGNPKGQPRPRAFVAGGKARVFDAGTAEGWKGMVALAAKACVPAAPIEHGQPVRVDIDFYLPRPKRLCRKKDPDGPVPHTARPDKDNLEKAVLDCLTELGFWRDDAQVCGGEVWKWYAAKDGKTGARIKIEAQ